MLNKAGQGPPRHDSAILRPAAVRASNALASYALFETRRRLSRADLARLTGLTRVTTSELVDMLERARVVRSVGFGQPRNGRPAELLEFEPNARFALGLELSDTQSRVVVTNLDGEPIREVAGAASPNKVVALRRAVALVSAALVDLPAGSVLGLGAGVPGIVDPITGAITAAADLGWRNVPVGGTLHEAFGLPVIVANRGKAAGLAECWCGVGRGCRHLVYVSLGSGIASSIVLDGQLYRGPTSSDGAFGHVTVVPDGRQCVCGNRGCLQEVAGVPALLRELDRVHPRARDEAWNLETVAQAARRGDALVVTAIREVAGYLGVAVANLVNILNPKMVVLGGPLPLAIPMLVDMVREEVARRALGAELRSLELTASTLGEQAVALGAATLVLNSAEVIEQMLRGGSSHSDVTAGLESLPQRWRGIQ